MTLDRARTTSLQRSYRYLRIAIASTVVVILVAIAVTIPLVGVLPSISHYYYTPARSLFVGALIAASVCFFALSGRGAERALLDVAALLAPLIAIVPTVISPGSIAGIEASCYGACVPAGYAADVDVGIQTYLIIGFMILILTAVLILTGEVERAGGTLSLAIGVAVLVVVGLGWWLWRAAFLQWAHYVVAICFFGIIAAVAVINGFFPTRSRKPTRWLTIAYGTIAIALALDVVALPVFGSLRFGHVYGVFIGEVLALVLFLAFWVLQSIQFWDAVDPEALGIAKPRPRVSPTSPREVHRG
ncbi:hypothetical protein [Microbacterium pumilum]|uniref:Uncharacterized protein n=1 Tax=Microbacterium pumilum TaxID=344165 RepID=A0ABN2T1F4_9MICO